MGAKYSITCISCSLSNIVRKLCIRSVGSKLFCRLCEDVRRKESPVLSSRFQSLLASDMNEVLAHDDSIFSQKAM